MDLGQNFLKLHLTPSKDYVCTQLTLHFLILAQFERRKQTGFIMNTR